MTFKPTLNKLNLLLVFALLAALLIPVMGVAASQSVAFNALFDSGSVENTQSGITQGSAIACSCGDPGGAGTGCC